MTDTARRFQSQLEPFSLAGRFWLPGDADRSEEDKHAVAGSLSYSPAAGKLTLECIGGGLGRNHLSRDARLPHAVVYGEVETHGLVSLVSAFPVTTAVGSGGISRQTLEIGSVLFGACVDPEDLAAADVASVRVQFAGLEDWLGVRAWSHQIGDNAQSFSATSHPRSEADLEFETAGALRIVTYAAIDIREFGAWSGTRTTYFELSRTFASIGNLHENVEQLGRLVWLLTGRYLPTRLVELFPSRDDSNDGSCPCMLLVSSVATVAPVPPSALYRPVLPRRALCEGRLSPIWTAQLKEYQGPVGVLVQGFMDGEVVAAEVHFLLAATAAEAFHKKLIPDVPADRRRSTVRQSGKARKQGPTFEDRLYHLVTEVSPAWLGALIATDPIAWVQVVRDERNALAHELTFAGSGTSLYRDGVRLRRLLHFHILAQLGVPWNDIQTDESLARRYAHVPPA